MKEQILETIESLVKAIYRLEINQIDEQFIKLIDQLQNFINSRPELDWDSVLLAIQDSYMNKDYVRFADTLLYDLKPYIE